MKAIVIGQRVSANLNDLIHGGGTYVKRLVVTEKDNLLINVYQDRVYAFFDFEIDDSCTILGEIDIPADLVEKAVAFAMAKEKLDEQKKYFEILLNTV